MFCCAQAQNEVDMNPDNPLGHEPIVGASLLAKNFASKLAPTIGKASNKQSKVENIDST